MHPPGQNQEILNKLIRNSIIIRIRSEEENKTITRYHFPFLFCKFLDVPLNVLSKSEGFKHFQKNMTNITM